MLPYILSLSISSFFFITLRRFRRCKSLSLTNNSKQSTADFSNRQVLLLVVSLWHVVDCSAACDSCSSARKSRQHTREMIYTQERQNERCKTTQSAQDIQDNADYARRINRVFHAYFSPLLSLSSSSVTFS